MPERSHLRATSSLSFAAALALSAFAGCKCSEDTPPPPLPATPPAPPPVQEEIQIVPEAQPIVDAGDDAAAKKSSSGPSLAKCCSALASNAELAPEPNKTYLKTAAATCSAAVAAGQSQSAVLAGVNAALKGVVGTPATCK
jgi:hypothetical protein